MGSFLRNEKEKVIFLIFLAVNSISSGLCSIIPYIHNVTVYTRKWFMGVISNNVNHSYIFCKLNLIEG